MSTPTRTVSSSLFGSIMGSSVSSGGGGERPPPDADPDLLKKARERPKEMTDEEWRSVLGEQAYRVARDHGTERAFTGELLDNKKEGELLSRDYRAFVDKLIIVSVFPQNIESPLLFYFDFLFAGIYLCTCCKAELFSSSTKYNSGSGWPSFYDTLKKEGDKDGDNVREKRDASLGMVRTEVLCK